MSIIFCAFTLASIVSYPGPFSPMDNWLSDLGNARMNPGGSIFFNVGCMLTGLAMFLLIVGMSKWRPQGWKKTAMVLGRACLSISALALMLIGVFTEGTPLHNWLAMTFFSMLFLFLVLTNVSVFSDRRYIRWIGYYAILVAVIDIVFMYTYIAYAHNTIWEWLAVFSALLWVVLLAYNMARLDEPAKTNNDL